MTALSGNRFLIVVVPAALVLALWGALAPATLFATFGVLIAIAALSWFVLLLRRRSGALAILVLIFAALDRPLAGLSAAVGAHAITGLFGVLDDVMLVGLLPLLFVGSATSARAVPRAAWIGFALFAAFGVAGIVFVHGNPQGAVMGTWLALKLPVSLLLASKLKWTPRTVSGVFWTLGAIFAVNAVVSMIELVAPSTVRGIFGGTDGNTERLGLTSLQGIFSHPVQAATFLLLTATVFIGAPHLSRRLRFVGYLSGGMAVLGLRAKTIVDVFLVVVLRLVTSSSRAIKLFTPLLVIIAAVAIFGASADLVVSRFSDVVESDTSARGALVETSLRIAANSLPFGSGFGSFGSEASRVHYSPVWEQYGLSQTYGFREGVAIFATDASWATVIGEAGFVGAAGMVVALLAIWFAQLRRARALSDTSWALTAVMFTTVVIFDSLASPRLFDGTAAIGLGILLALSAWEQDRWRMPVEATSDVSTFRTAR